MMDPRHLKRGEASPTSAAVPLTSSLVPKSHAYTAGMHLI